MGVTWSMKYKYFCSRVSLFANFTFWNLSELGSAVKWTSKGIPSAVIDGSILARSLWKVVWPCTNSWKTCLMSWCVSIPKWHYSLLFLVHWRKVGHQIPFSRSILSHPMVSISMCVNVCTAVWWLCCAWLLTRVQSSYKKERMCVVFNTYEHFLRELILDFEWDLGCYGKAWGITISIKKRKTREHNSQISE